MTTTFSVNRNAFLNSNHDVFHLKSNNDYYCDIVYKLLYKNVKCKDIDQQQGSMFYSPSAQGSMFYSPSAPVKGPMLSIYRIAYFLLFK